MTHNLTFALVGNQNSGKTTLFNQLTGSNQRVGNFPGVTMDRKDGRIKDHEYAGVVDLPGIYSLSPYSKEEMVTRDYLIEEKPDAIINIVDATNIERNLYLSLQLIELAIPMVIALNMMDEMRTNNNTVDIERLSAEMGVPVVPISASKNEGIHDLVDTAIETAMKKQKPQVEDFCTGPVHRCIHGIGHIIEHRSDVLGVPRRFAATKLVEGDEPMQKQLQLGERELVTVERIVKEMEDDLGTDREAALADMRYQFIERVAAETVTRSGLSKERKRSIRADALLTHRFLAIPIFLVIMFVVFWLTFAVIGEPLSDLLNDGLDHVIVLVESGLTALAINPVVVSLVCDGILTGVFTVVGFLPVIVTLFFFMSLLEDTGYMARVAFVMDKPLRKLGLSGRSIVPLLLGFGCTVPATMATRTLPSERDREMTIILTPYMTCSAKLPIFAVFSSVFFPRHSALVMMALYLLSIAVTVINALILNRLPRYRGKPVPFVMELPNYRLPSAKSVGVLLWEKARGFITRAFTVIFVGTIIVWFLQSFDFRFNPVANSENSMLALVAGWIAPIFNPVGFGFWQATVALFAGFMAKEAVISTLAILAGTSVEGLPVVLGAMFTPLSAFSFMVFTLLYTPCLAAVASVKQELNSTAAAVGLAAVQMVVAWLWAFLVYQMGSLFFV